MDASRERLRSKLIKVIGCEDRLYYQPPESKKLDYPCIIYALSDINMNYADDRPYTATNKYSVTVIDRNPDTLLRSKMVEEFSMISFERFFVADNLNHYVFTVFI